MINLKCIVLLKCKNKSPSLMFKVLIPSRCLEAINDSFPLIRRTFNILWSLIEQPLSRQHEMATLQRCLKGRAMHHQHRIYYTICPADSLVTVTKLLSIPWPACVASKCWRPEWCSRGCCRVKVNFHTSRFAHSPAASCSDVAPCPFYAVD